MKKIFILIAMSFMTLNAQTDINFDYESSTGSGDRSHRWADAPSADRDLWFTLTASIDPSCPAGCKIDHELNILADLDSYTHYKVSDGTNTTSLTAFTLPTKGKRQNIEGAFFI